MKKVLCLFLILICTTSSSWARPGSAIEIANCKKFGGEIISLQLPYPQLYPRARSKDFCYFDIRQGMDARTLYVSRYDNVGPMANEAYHKMQIPNSDACQLTGGQKVTGLNNSSSYEICLYWDDSAIDNLTLTHGMSSSWNQEINRALGF